MHEAHAQLSSAFTNPSEELLLTAALIEGPLGLAAWDKWKREVDFESHMDYSSFRILPILYKNLANQSVSDPLIGRLKGIYKHSWFKNQQLFLKTAKVLQFLKNQNIRCMLLKGAALSIQAYEDNAIRSMADVDFMIHVSDFKKANQHLLQQGWKSPYKQPLKEIIKYRKSIQYINSIGEEIDIHWSPYNEYNRDYLDDIWQNAEKIRFANMETWAPSLTDSLIHVIIHGSCWNEERTFRWITDASVILNKKADQIDWDRFIEIAQRNTIGSRVNDAIKYLNNQNFATVPSEVIEQLEQVKPRQKERIIRKYALVDPALFTAKFGYIPFYLLDWFTLSNQQNIFMLIYRFPGYLKFVKSMDSILEVYTYLAKSVIKKLFCR